MTIDYGFNRLLVLTATDKAERETRSPATVRAGETWLAVATVDEEGEFDGWSYGRPNEVKSAEEYTGADLLAMEWERCPVFTALGEDHPFVRPLDGILDDTWTWAPVAHAAQLGACSAA